MQGVSSWSIDRESLSRTLRYNGWLDPKQLSAVEHSSTYARYYDRSWERWHLLAKGVIDDACAVFVDQHSLLRQRQIDRLENVLLGEIGAARHIITAGASASTNPDAP